MAGEFDLIAKYFAPLAGPEGLGLLDDAACLRPTPGFDLIVTKDLIVEGVHFLPSDPAASIAHKALAVNLSDLAAKGAVPRYYFLGLSLPVGTSDAWLADFAAALRSLQSESGIMLAGGDTTRSPGPVMISITAMGAVPSGQMIRRAGAKVGDDIYVSGYLGDGALGLACLEGRIADDADLVKHYRYPAPRLALGGRLRGLATASADISDGLLADLGHICEASKVGATIHQPQLPVSDAGLRVVAAAPDMAALIYSGGDDYELVFTASATARGEIQGISRDLAIPITCIGQITAAPGVQLVDLDGRLVQTAKRGFQHFDQ